ncbi:MAG: DUF4198 domain-containing protein [Paenibacillaceae bacterium]|nr:DUF4198 domain-containing protein [Paenibacillaceae bacterium]
MRVQAMVLCFVVVWGMQVVVVQAHDGWIQANTPITARGETVYVDMLFGNHTQEHRSYRIDGQWPSASIFVTDARGLKTDITATRFYTGEPATESAPVRNNGFVASFRTSLLGISIVNAEGDSVYKGTTSTTRTLRSAKAFVAVSDIPVRERVAQLKQFSRVVTPDRLELIPISSPVAIQPGQTLTVQLVRQGMPVANTPVSLIRRSINNDPITKNTDESGKVSFVVGSADYYLLRAKIERTLAAPIAIGEHIVQKETHEATMTVIVQNAQPAFSLEATTATPTGEVNGTMLPAHAISIKNGVAHLVSTVARTYVDESLSEASVPLRALVTKHGGVVEYLPAMGPVPAHIVVSLPQKSAHEK